MEQNGEGAAGKGQAEETTEEPGKAQAAVGNVRLDDSTTVGELRTMVAKFVDERNWQQFHAPKNLSMALAIEAAELMEHFQWLSIEESKTLATDQEKLEAVGEELADVLCYGLAMANALELDVAQIMTRKMEKNRAKYPVERYQGRYE